MDKQGINIPKGGRGALLVEGQSNINTRANNYKIEEA